MQIPSETPKGKKIETIAVSVSGGADSTILLYLLAKEIIDKKLDVKIQPFTIRRKRPTHPKFARIAVDKVVELLDTDVIKPIIEYATVLIDEEEAEFFRQTYIYFLKNGTQMIYDGLTAIPPIDVLRDFKNPTHQRIIDQRDPTVHREEKRYYYDAEEDFEFIYFQPFVNQDKRYIASLYEQEGVMETLFTVTRSCETVDESKWDTHCGRCWWCEERQWAFNRLF